MYMQRGRKGGQRRPEIVRYFWARTHTAAFVLRRKETPRFSYNKGSVSRTPTKGVVKCYEFSLYFLVIRQETNVLLL